MDSTATLRHCAFCLKSICNKAIKLCGKCRKRAYCSRECQISDWSSQGQGHKNWCHLQCGEEDVDWKVNEIPGKGLGLIAMRMIPAKYRIIVDCDRSLDKDHPGIKDLMPVNGTYQEKYELNCLGCGNDNDSALCLRISRANHDCNANADHVYDETFHCVILFAQKDIAEGEEICINYQLYNDVSRDISAQFTRSVLQKKWGIICSKNCFCYKKEMEELIAKSKKLDKKISSLALQGNITQSLDMVKELMNNHDIINSSFLNKTRTLYDGFQIAVMKKSTLQVAKTFIENLYAIQSAIMSPESLAVKKTESLMNDITKHQNYLLFK